MNSLILSAVLFLLFLLPLRGQYKNIVFDRITRQEGFNGESCDCFLQDHLGFIWIGGVGINKYDGYKFTHYLELPGCKNCPPTTNYYIKKMVEDDLDLIWLLTVNGVAIFDPEKERTVLLKPPQMPDFNKEFNSYTGDIIKDSKGNIWASDENGLLKVSYSVRGHKPVTSDMIFRYGTDSIYTWKSFCNSPDMHSDNNKVQRIYEDSYGNIWAGTRNGLYFLKNGNEKFIRIDTGYNGVSRLAGNEVRDILQYDDDTFWIATYSGITRISNTRRFLDEDIQGNTRSLRYSSFLKSEGIITSLMKDRSGNLFIGTSANLLILPGNEKNDVPNFDLVYKNQNDLSGIGYNSGVLSIMQDNGGEIWVAHNFNYIIKFNLKKSYFTSYEDMIRKNFRHFEAISLQGDNYKNLWVGTYLGDLFKFRREDLKVTKYNQGGWNPIRYLINAGRDNLLLGQEWGITGFNTLNGTFYDPVSGSSVVSAKLKNTRVYSLLKDSNIIYISSQYGIFALNTATHKVIQGKSSTSDSVLIDNDHYYQLIKSVKGEIWVASSYKGLSRICYDRKANLLSIIPYVSDKFSDLNILGADNVALYQENDSIMWLGNQHLQKIYLKTGEIQTFKLFTDIDFVGVYSILDDDKGNLWLGTEFGLCRFNKKNGDTKLFTKEDGWPIKGHTLLNAYKNVDGTMYFGGEGGFYSFNPDSIKADTYIPPVVITAMQLMNRELKVDTSGKGVLSYGIPYTASIELAHNQNNVSFEFASLDYTRPMKNRYAYKLEGYQNNWIETDAGNRMATFTNLNPGKYTLRIKGSNSDGIWNENGTSLLIKIRHPWWSNPIAWSIYMISVMLFVTFYIKWRTWRLTKEKSEIEAMVKVQTIKVEEQKSEILMQKNLLEEQNQKIIELDRIKSRFFANISHEFRTPLALIQGPVEELLDNPHRTVKERTKLNIVYRNAKRLLNLVSQLLDISRIEASQMKLEITESDIIVFLRSLTASFNSLAETKDIRYKCIFPSENIKTWFDPDKCEKIVTNLLSNAFKFTPGGGTIIFSAGYIFNHDQIPVSLQFSVQDNGCGIAQESILKIFDRFYQVEESLRRESGGAGIGLSLVNDLVRLIHGEVTVTSMPGEGSTFCVRFPLGKEHLDKSEYSIMTEFNEPVISTIVSGSEIDSVIEEKEDIAGKKPVLLLVEDNNDIRIYLADNLQSKYNIKVASDGVVGLKKASEIMPDLIITDLMMPFMDGIELCRKLKSDESTSHIPVIMLTAKATVPDKIFGLQTGADDYIPKPFHMAELKARVNNLIEQRKRLRERFTKELNVKLSDITVTSIDEKFLQKAVTLVDQHLKDEKFDISMFREKMNMSSSTLFRKLSALTNQSPTEFIRTLRLKRAASLLSQNFGNITQISLEAGFNNISYFNKSFKKMFGVTPTDYSKNNQL